jgi:SAM-dependent methyltransferase
MTITLATTWYPRGELPRFTRLLPVLEENYAGIVVSFIPNEDKDALDQITSGRFSSHSKLSFFVNNDQRRGRYTALQKALETSAEYVHYADMDRLLRWVETRPEEWKQTLNQIEKAECLIMGRTEAANRTHPQALVLTEQISNELVSHILEREMDVSAGSKSFSRAAAQYLVDHCQEDNAVGSDAEWPILLKKAGFKLGYIELDGLDWESADRFQLQAADEQVQHQAAKEYDMKPEHWLHRVKIAQEIIHTALEVAQEEQPYKTGENVPKVDFDVEAVFDVDDYLYFYSESLTDERTDVEVRALVRLLELDAPMKILDLACGFGRHTNRLAALGHRMTGVDITPGFLEIARQDALNRKVNVQYMLGDMRHITFKSKFDCVVLLFTAFGYFSDEENYQVLVNVRKALKPGGLFVFDTHNRDGFLKGLQPSFVTDKEGNMMIDRISFDSIQGRFYNKRVVFRNGIRKDKPFFVRLYNPNEIQALINQAGLEVEQIYGGWDAKPLSSETRQMVIVARRPK